MSLRFGNPTGKIPLCMSWTTRLVIVSVRSSSMRLLLPSSSRDSHPVMTNAEILGICSLKVLTNGSKNASFTLLVHTVPEREEDKMDFITSSGAMLVNFFKNRCLVNLFAIWTKGVDYLDVVMHISVDFFFRLHRTDLSCDTRHSRIDLKTLITKKFVRDGFLSSSRPSKDNNVSFL